MKRLFNYLMPTRRLRILNAGLLVVGLAGAACGAVGENYPNGWTKSEVEALRDALQDDVPAADSSTVDCVVDWTVENFSVEDFDRISSSDEDMSFALGLSLLQACPGILKYADN